MLAKNILMTALFYSFGNCIFGYINFSISFEIFDTIWSVDDDGHLHILIEKIYLFSFMRIYLIRDRSV